MMIIKTHKQRQTHFLLSWDQVEVASSRAPESWWMILCIELRHLLLHPFLLDLTQDRQAYPNRALFHAIFMHVTLDQLNTHICRSSQSRCWLVSTTFSHEHPVTENDVKIDWYRFHTMHWSSAWCNVEVGYLFLGIIPGKRKGGSPGWTALHIHSSVWHLY